MKAFPAIYELGPDFYDTVKAALFPKGVLRYRNQNAAQILGLNFLNENEWRNHFWQFLPLAENLEAPLALRYHGHQFQHYNPDLGDGRGFLFAQFLDSQNKFYDLGTKGSGQTPYSRSGDGRLTLKGAVREVLATEMLESLGVNTSRTFSVFETGESLHRNDEPSPTRSAVLVRMTHGHIRIGTFQRLAFFQQKENILKLVCYCVKHYYPELQEHLDDPMVTALFFREVVRRNAKLVAQVMMAGFVHGVLNTDNINISGELFDYGPYRFLPSYDPLFTAAYFDHQGLYAFGRQPPVFLWNLHQLGLALKVAVPDLPTEDILENFGDDFNESVLKSFLSRLGVNSLGITKDQDLLSNFFELIENKNVLFEQAFFDFFGGFSNSKISLTDSSLPWRSSPQLEMYDQNLLQKFLIGFKEHTPSQPDLRQHPYFKSLRPQSLLIDEIEAIWLAIAENDDWTLFEKKIEQIKSFRGIYPIL